MARLSCSDDTLYDGLIMKETGRRLKMKVDVWCNGSDPNAVDELIAWWCYAVRSDLVFLVPGTGRHCVCQAAIVHHCHVCQCWGWGPPGHSGLWVDPIVLVVGSSSLGLGNQWPGQQHDNGLGWATLPPNDSNRHSIEMRDGLMCDWVIDNKNGCTSHGACSRHHFYDVIVAQQYNCFRLHRVTAFCLLRPISICDLPTWDISLKEQCENIIQLGSVP